MTKARAEYVYKLIGTIYNQKRQDIKYRAGYKLEVEIQNKPHIKKIRVWQDRLENPVIWQNIEQGNYTNKKYYFFCRNHMGNYFLVNWEELNHE